MRKSIKFIFVVVAMSMAVPALADPPPWAGGGKGKGKGHDRDAQSERYFQDQHAVSVHDYYGEQFRSGSCPPGLAKKNNGCMPPGQAKKWQMGRPLPRDVVYYPVEPALVVRLGEPPPGHRYVRVDGDILLLAAGSSMVVDAIQNLGRR